MVAQLNRLNKVGADLWPWAAAALIVAFSLTPRIPLDIAIPGRTFDLRVADVVLATTVIVGIASLIAALPRITLAKQMAIYVGTAAASTVAGIATASLNPARGILYLGKEVEYFLLYAVVFIAARNARHATRLVQLSVILAILNAIWMGRQLMAGTYGTLLSAERALPTDVFVSPQRFNGYGPRMIGEFSPLSIGLYFTICGLIATAFALAARSTRTRAIFLPLIWVLAAGCTLSGSRVSMLATGVGLAYLLLANPVSWRYRATVALVATSAFMAVLVASTPTSATSQPTPTASSATVSLAATASSNETPRFDASSTPPLGTSQPTPLATVSVNSGGTAPVGAVPYLNVRLEPSDVELSITKRLTTIWLPLLSQARDRIVIGWGKGSIGDEYAGEAHNYALRLLVETGLLGLIAFSYLIWRVTRLGVSISRTPGPSQALGHALVASVIAMVVASSVQDAFTPVLPNELLWTVAGLAAGAWAFPTVSRGASKWRHA